MLGVARCAMSMDSERADQFCSKAAEVRTVSESTKDADARRSLMAVVRPRPMLAAYLNRVQDKAPVSG